MKTNPECSPWQLEIANTMQAAERLCGELLEKAKRQGFHEADRFAIHLALEEAFVNAVQHGNQSDPKKKIFVRYSVTPDRFDVTVSDQGPGFNPNTLPDPRDPENLCKSSGRGVLLIRAYMDQVEYNPKGNQIRMVKFKGGRDPHAGPSESKSS
jgi:serine/threonine-protein kinase RsbW